MDVVYCLNCLMYNYYCAHLVSRFSRDVSLLVTPRQLDFDNDTVMYKIPACFACGTPDVSVFFCAGLQYLLFFQRYVFVYQFRVLFDSRTHYAPTVRSFCADLY